MKRLVILVLAFLLVLVIGTDAQGPIVVRATMYLAEMESLTPVGARATVLIAEAHFGPLPDEVDISFPDSGNERILLSSPDEGALEEALAILRTAWETGNMARIYRGCLEILDSEPSANE